MATPKNKKSKRSFLLPKGCKNIGDIVVKRKKILSVKVNGRIKASRVDLRDSEGKKLGIFPLIKALNKAKICQMDIVEMHPNIDPPICFLIDYGRFKFRHAKGLLPKLI